MIQGRAQHDAFVALLVGVPRDVRDPAEVGRLLKSSRVLELAEPARLAALARAEPRAKRAVLLHHAKQAFGRDELLRTAGGGHAGALGAARSAEQTKAQKAKCLRTMRQTDNCTDHSKPAKDIHYA